MFSTLSVVRLVALKVALPMPTTVEICRHANQGARGRSTSDNRNTGQEDILEEELDMDEVEAKLETLLKEEKKRQKATKFHKIRRLLSPRGAPERRLTWDAIDQIRYLKQEFPQEWTVKRLAESYSVDPDIITRILRSKFIPTAERRNKQDVLAMASQLSLGHGRMDGSRLSAPGSTKPVRLSLGNMGTLTCPSGGALAKTECETRLVPTTDAVKSLSRGMPQTSGPPVAQNMSQERSHEKEGLMGFKEENGLDWEQEEKWDGVVFTEEELEDIISTMHEKPSAVEQKGKEFFDSEGNFLYRI